MYPDVMHFNFPSYQNRKIDELGDGKEWRIKVSWVSGGRKIL